MKGANNNRTNFNYKYKYCFMLPGVTGSGLFRELISRAEFPSFFYIYNIISHAFGCILSISINS